MAINCIHSIEITTNNSETFVVTSDDFNNFYVANIDENGEETKYMRKNNNLYANFFMIRIHNDDINNEIVKRLYQKKDIIKIELFFTNGVSQEIILPQKRVIIDGIMHNKYEYTHLINNDLCILVSDKKIKYINNLFV